MKFLLSKLIYLASFLSKMPNEKLQLKIFRNYMRKVVFNDDCLYFLNDCNRKTGINVDSNKKNILLITHSYSRTGAPKVALETAKTLRKLYNVEVYIVGPEFDELQNDFENEGFKTFYFSDLPQKKSLFIEFCNQFEAVVVSSQSTQFFYALEMCKAEIKTPIIWYPHEIYIKGDMLLNVACKNSDLILCGSPLTRSSITESMENIKTVLGIYGLKRVEIPSGQNRNKVVFSCFGTLSTRKNQKVFAEAIIKLPEDIRKQCQFNIVGSAMMKDDFQYEKSLREMLANVKEVHFSENVPLDKLFEYYAESDCIVCPSEKDPMPIVVTYAFMFNKIPVISDKIGQVLLCEDKRNALIFEHNDSKRLAEIMTDIVVNRDSYSDIEKNSGEIYNKYFSMESFENMLKSNMDQFLL